jgi:hypothetical protein
MGFGGDAARPLPGFTIDGISSEQARLDRIDLITVKSSGGSASHRLIPQGSPVHVFYFAADHGALRREKAGRTYKLFVSS